MGTFDPETGLNDDGLTREQQDRLDVFIAQNPNGIDLSNPDSFYNPNAVTSVTPVDPVANLGVGDPDPETGQYAPRSVAPVSVSAASNYALTGAVPVTPVNPGNPFARPESQQGIGSLGGG